MARYIDADKLIEKWHNTLKDKNPDDLAYKCFTLFIDGLKKEPSADVVPKSEVEKIFEEIDLIHKKVFVDVAKMSLGDLEKTVLYEYFKLIGGCTNTLKKKYTESEDKR